jgi:heptosyltransferase-2
MQDQQNSKKILIVGPAWLGDMIMAQALFKVLKNNSDCRIDVVAPAWSSPILARMPEVFKTITIPIKHGELALGTRRRLAKQLRNEKYDQAIVLTNTWKSALLPFWAKIPLRTGWLGELRWGLLNDVRYLNKKKLPTMMQRYVALAYPRGAEIPTTQPMPMLAVAPALVQTSLNKFQLSVQNKKIMALCPGAAGGTAKRWPEQYYMQLAQAKIKDGWEIWLFGSEQDAPVTANIQQQLAKNCQNFAGKLQLAETVDLMSVVNVVISNDSGLMHMASSLNKYLIAIYGATSPKFTPPFGQHAKIVTNNLSCSPCFKKECPLKHHQCMHAITPEQILELLKKDGW